MKGIYKEDEKDLRKRKGSKHEEEKCRGRGRKKYTRKKEEKGNKESQCR